MAKQYRLQVIPNLVTLTSLFCGCLGVTWALDQQLDLAVYMIWICAGLDVLDGLVARALGVSSNLGKQLDSLADLIAFGLLPATILYAVSLDYIAPPWSYAVFLITVFSAIRLARFNLDPDQEVNFRGLPTPANALLISSFPYLITQNLEFLRPGLENQFVWLLIVAVLSYLLVSRIPLLGFKFSNYGWADNKYRYLIFGLVAILCLSIGVVSAIPWIILAYFLVSLVWYYNQGPLR